MLELASVPIGALEVLHQCRAFVWASIQKKGKYKKCVIAAGIEHECCHVETKSPQAREKTLETMNFAHK